MATTVLLFHLALRQCTYWHVVSTLPVRIRYFVLWTTHDYYRIAFQLALLYILGSPLTNFTLGSATMASML